jgi:hypothetical protein
MLDLQREELQRSNGSAAANTLETGWQLAISDDNSLAPVGVLVTG